MLQPLNDRQAQRQHERMRRGLGLAHSNLRPMGFARENSAPAAAAEPSGIAASGGGNENENDGAEAMDDSTLNDGALPMIE